MAELTSNQKNELAALAIHRRAAKSSIANREANGSNPRVLAQEKRDLKLVEERMKALAPELDLSTLDQEPAQDE